MPVGHAIVERRSLRYHSAIAERLSRDPSVLSRARVRVETWLSDGSVATHYATGWRQILSQSVDDIGAFLTEDSERAIAFRQVSPFAGALSAKERWKLWAIEDAQR